MHVRLLIWISMAQERVLLQFKWCFEKKHNLIKDSKTRGDTIAGMNSGFISNVEDVHDALKEYFENG